VKKLASFVLVIIIENEIEDFAKDNSQKSYQNTGPSTRQSIFGIYDNYFFDNK
jgi:hypothetical protein